jgi:hypothetical protein
VQSEVQHVKVGSKVGGTLSSSSGTSLKANWAMHVNVMTEMVMAKSQMDVLQMKNNKIR